MSIYAQKLRTHLSGRVVKCLGGNFRVSVGEFISLLGHVRGMFFLYAYIYYVYIFVCI